MSKCRSGPVLSALVILAGILSAAAQDGNSDERLGPLEKVRVDLSVMQVKPCLHSAEGYSGNGVRTVSKRLDLYVRLRLGITNQDVTPIIISRYSLEVVRASTRFSAEKAFSHGTYTWSPMRMDRNMETPEPPGFVTLKTGESMEVDLNYFTFVKPRDLRKARNGMYAKYQIVSWLGYSEIGMESAKWKRFGRLLLKDIRTEPIFFKVPDGDLSDGCNKP